MINSLFVIIYGTMFAGFQYKGFNVMEHFKVGDLGSIYRVANMKEKATLEHLERVEIMIDELKFTLAEDRSDGEDVSIHIERLVVLNLRHISARGDFIRAKTKLHNIKYEIEFSNAKKNNVSLREDFYSGMLHLRC